MDKNTALLLALTGESSRWEDEERGNYDVEQLRQEFTKHLYADEILAAEAIQKAAQKATDSKGN